MTLREGRALTRLHTSETHKKGVATSMNPKKLQIYISTVLSVFSALTAAAGLTTVSQRVAVAILIASGFSAVAAAALIFRARRHSGLGTIGELVEPVYQARRATEKDLKAVAEIDQETYGDDSVDYEGLAVWWRRYDKGVTVLLEDAEIIGAVGIWPLKEAAFDHIVAGSIDERGLDEQSVCESADPEPRARWYFGDIILLKKFHSSMKNLSGQLLMAAVADWVKQGNLADELHLCAVAIRPRPSWWAKAPVVSLFARGLRRLFGRRAALLGDGDRALLRFGFKEVGLSPSGQPVYTRTLTKQQLLEEVERRIRRRVEAARERAERRSGSSADGGARVRRWQWAPAAIAAALLITVIAVRQLPAYNDGAHAGRFNPPDSPQELARQTASVLRVGLQDHTHCAIDAWDESAQAEEQMAAELGAKYAPLIGVVRESLGAKYEVAAAHNCAARGREFVHVILRGGPRALVSVAITDARDESFPRQGAASEQVVSGVALYRSNLKTFEVAGFDVLNYRVFVVSNLDREENLGIAEKLAPPVQKFLLML